MAASAGLRIDVETSLPRALAASAEAHPERGVGLLDRRGRLVGRRTWRQVLASARASAGRLAAAGVRPGDRVLVAVPTSPEWFDAWFGALLLGALPVAMTSQAAAGADTLPRRRLASILRRLSPALVVGGQALVDGLARADGDGAGGPATPASEGDGADDDAPGDVAPDVLALTPEQLAATAPATFSAPDDVDPSATAFLQLTSGSTGRPRAVRISHRAAVHNSWAIDEAMGAPFGRWSHEVVEGWASWVPLHHDMGLNSTLSLMLTGLDLWLSPPQAFLGRPRTWLEQLGAHGPSIATAPNFGYQLCVERIGEDELAGLDLSHWKVAISAAEMIRIDTVTAFVDKFAACGFRGEAYRCSYGLAEGTVAVSVDRRGRGARTLPMPAGNAVAAGLDRVVCVGEPVMDTALRIVHPDGTVAAERQVGEVQVRGPGVFSGYYGDPEATADALRDGWLATGDLGFLADGELYVVGRLKDVLIIRGTNVMPHEIEWLAESVAGGGGASRAAAFSITRGPAGEEVVVVLEVSDRDGPALAATADEVASRVGREVGLPLADVVLLRRGRIPRTTSGKVRRDELRASYLAGRLQRLGG